MKPYKNSIPIPPELRRLLEKNGLDVQLVINEKGQHELKVAGNRGLAMSPPQSYVLTPRQANDIINAYAQGTGFRLKKGYETVNQVIAKDFMAPQSYTIASNTGLNRRGTANRLSPVNMGWNYVVDIRRYFDHYHDRAMISRPDGSLKPGEAAAMRTLPNGAYVPTAGYIYKGNMAPTQQQQEVPQQMNSVVVNMAPTPAPRPELENVEKLSDLYTSTPENDTYKMLQPVLDHHGIVIKEGLDEEGNPEKQLVVMAQNAKVNIVYHLTEEEYQKLTADGWRDVKNENDVSLQDRLNIINEKISLDFKEPITAEMLDGDSYVNLTYKDGRREVNEAKYIEYEKKQSAREMRTAERMAIKNDLQAIDGRDVSSILKEKAFFYKGKEGRQMTVGEIRVDAVADPEKGEKTKYMMSAVIDGQRHSVEISQKNYKTFIGYDDKHRLEMFASKFDVKIAKGQDNSWALVNGKDGIRPRGFYAAQNAQSGIVNESILQQLGKGFYEDQKGGRQKEVSNIMVYDVSQLNNNERERLNGFLPDTEKKELPYVMVATIDGRDVAHYMTDKQFDSYMKSNDKGKLEIADKLFDEFKIKAVPEERASGERKGNFRKGLLGFLGAVAGGAIAVLSIKHEHDMFEHRHHRRYGGMAEPYRGTMTRTAGIPAVEKTENQHQRVSGNDRVITKASDNYEYMVQNANVEESEDMVLHR